MSADNTLASVRRTVAGIVRQIGEGRSETATAIKGLTLHHVDHSTEPSSYLYEPCFAFIAQGAKRVVLGTETYVYDESQFLLTAVGLPTVVQVLGATPSRPYLSIKLDFDLDLAKDLIAEVDETGTRPQVQTSGLAVSPVTPKLADSIRRLVELLTSPDEIPILAGGIQKELLYRVLISPVGDRLREAVLRGSQTNRVTTAIRYIRKNFAHPIRIETLAEKVGMGASTLHNHFRAVTTMSPIQYQKQLRLHEARRLMLRDETDVAGAAYRVGYESANQFSREYRRLFGSSPKTDVRRLMSTPQEPGSTRRSS